MLIGLWLIALKNISYKGNSKRLERSLARIFTNGTKGPIKTLTSVQTKKNSHAENHACKQVEVR